MSDDSLKSLKKIQNLIGHDLNAIGLSIDETIGRNATNQHTRSALRAIRSAIDDLQEKLRDLTNSSNLFTKRESEILNALTSAMTAAEIADFYSISEPTVKSHMASIYRKLGVSNKTSALAEGKRRGLITP